MRLLSLKTNERAAKDGDWVGDLPGFEGFRVRLRPLSCDAAIAYQDRLQTEVFGRRGARRLKSYPPEVLAYVQAKTLIDVCVSDWAGLDVPVDAAGAVAFDPREIVAERQIPYSKEALAAILLEAADGGEIVTDPPPGEEPRRFRTPDGLRPRAAMREFLGVLVAAAALSADDPETEKNAFAGGSSGTVAKPRKLTPAA